jgi:hypothetical protein
MTDGRVDDVEVGDRVRLEEAATGAPGTQGYVIEPDPYGDRDIIVRIGFEDGTSRWLHKERLRRFGDYQADPATVLADWEARAAWKRVHFGVDRPGREARPVRLSAPRRWRP